MAKRKASTTVVSFSEIASRAVAHAKFWRAFTAVVSAEAYDDLRESLLFELDLENTKLSEAESQAANRLKAEFVLVPSLDENDWRTVATGLSIWNAATAVFDDDFAKQIGNAIRARIIKNRSQSSDWTHAIVQSIALNEPGQIKEGDSSKPYELNPQDWTIFVQPKQLHAYFPHFKKKTATAKRSAWTRIANDLRAAGLLFDYSESSKDVTVHRSGFVKHGGKIPVELLGKPE